MDINIGIDAKNRQQIVQGPGNLLADSYMIYLKTHHYRSGRVPGSGVNRQGGWVATVGLRKMVVLTG